MKAQYSPEQLVERLAAVPIFADLDRAILQQIAGAAVRREYSTGQVLFLEGEPLPGLFILDSGLLKVVKTSVRGREHILEVLGPSQPVNAVSVLTRQPSPATGIAIEPIQAWLLPRAVVSQLLRDHPVFAELVIENMAEHMIRLVELVADLSLKSVMERLAKLLLEEAVDDTVVRPRWLTLAELAARLGTVPDVAQRALGRLGADGLVEASRREIKIKDRRGLELLAG